MRDPDLSILICEPPNASGDVWLPIVFSSLKTYCDQDPELRERCRWLDPIWIAGGIEERLLGVDLGRVDVLGISCYVWNMDFNMEVARRAREQNPNCLIVAGGPHIDYEDDRFFAKYPHVDVVVVHNGEVPFGKLLHHRLAGGSRAEQEKIPGLVLPSPLATAPPVRTGPTEFLTEYALAPFAHVEGRLHRLIERVPPDQRVADISSTWETNRGCPYGCTFCVWGVAAQHKLRRMDLGAKKRDAEALGRLGVGMLFIADANFGILETDLDICDALISVHERTGHPLCVYYSSSKNDADRNYEVARRLFEAGLSLQHPIAIQHTDPEVLETIERRNLPPDRMDDLITKLRADGVPLFCEVILGCPGDTPERWRTCLTDILEMGFHGDMSADLYNLLPNSPAAEPAYIDRYQLQWIERPLSITTSRRSKETVNAVTGTARYVVATSSYSRADWVDMYLFKVLIATLHNLAFTRFIAIYLRRSHDVDYRAFYDALYDELFAGGAGLLNRCYRHLRKHLERFISEPNASEELELEELPDYPNLVQPDDWFFIQLTLQADAAWAELTAYLAQRYPQAPSLASVINYQTQVLIDPTYSRRRGRRLQLSHRWVEYFTAEQQLELGDPMPEPEPAGHTVVSRDRMTGRWNLELDMDEFPEAQRIGRWIEVAVPFPYARNEGTFLRTFTGEP